MQGLPPPLYVQKPQARDLGSGLHPHGHVWHPMNAEGIMECLPQVLLWCAGGTCCVLDAVAGAGDPTGARTALAAPPPLLPNSQVCSLHTSSRKPSPITRSLCQEPPLGCPGGQPCSVHLWGSSVIAGASGTWLNSNAQPECPVGTRVCGLPRNPGAGRLHYQHL